MTHQALTPFARKLALAFLLALLPFQAHAACSSFTAGNTIYYNCDGKLSRETTVGPYTSYSQDRRPVLREKAKPVWNRSNNVSRETYRPQRQKPRYGWQRYSK